MKNFKVEFYPNTNELHGRFISYHEFIEEAVSVLNNIADYTLLLHECSFMRDYSNIGMLFTKNNNEWIAINEDGTSFD